VNYDPALVIRIFSFLDTQSDYNPPERLFDEETLQKMSQERLLSETDLSIEGISVLLINKKTNLPIARLSLKALTVRMSIYYY
jgi:hypothetical protein